MSVTLRGTRESIRGLTVLLVALLVPACKAGGPAPAPAGGTVSTAGGAASGVEWFTDIAAASGLDFVHFNGMSGEHYYPEIMAPGVALLDYDNDGDLDVYVVQGQMLGAGKDVRAAIFKPGGALEDRLFRNDLVVNPDGTRPSTGSGRPELVEGRDMIGARVSISRGAVPTIWRRARSDGSYASANDPRVLVGLGESTGPVTVRVQWPDGKAEEWANQAIDRWVTLQQGSGK